MLRRVFAWVALTLVGLLLVVVAINLFDERVSPEAHALAQPPENPYSPDENIYVALAGLGAPAGQPPVSWGNDRIARYNASQDSAGGGARIVIRSGLDDDPDQLSFSGAFDLCRPREQCFWDSVRSAAPKIRQLADANRELYGRYLSLFGKPGYYETARLSYSTPVFWPSPDLRNLFVANTALSIQTGNEAQVQAALSALRQDAQLWQRVLTGEGTLMAKMISVGYLQVDSLVLSEAIADPKILLPKNMEEFLPEFTADTWNIGKAFAVEFRFHEWSYWTLCNVDEHYRQGTVGSGSLFSRMWNPFGSAGGRLLLKFNATQNLDATLMNELTAFASLDPQTYSDKRHRLHEWELKHGKMQSIPALYNPVGKILVSQGVSFYSNYLLRPYDAAAFQRLVRLSYEIRRQQVAPPDIAAFMQAHPEWATHPADGSAFEWDATRNEISFRPVAKQPADRRFAVRIWRAPGG